MSDEYNLSEAGAFGEKDLLEFRDSEVAKGNTVRRIYVTRLQSNHLANDIAGVRPKRTGSKLVDFWNEPKQPTTLQTVHGIEVWIEE